MDQYRPIFLTPTLLFRLISLNPDVVVAYAYSIPTIIAFVYCFLTGKSFVSLGGRHATYESRIAVEQNWVRRFIIPRAAA